MSILHISSGVQSVRLIPSGHNLKQERHPMTTSQLNPDPSKVFGTVAKLLRLTEKEGVEWSHWLNCIFWPILITHSGLS